MNNPVIQLLLITTNNNFSNKKCFPSISASKWNSKPASLSPPFCAIYGWSLFQEDALQCNDCEEMLIAKLPKQNDELYSGIHKIGYL